jgi:FMN phosphatase YigB (HAD superfamily)
MKSQRQVVKSMSKQRAIEGLLFDLGGVVIDINFEKAFQAWKQSTTLTIDDLRRGFKMDETYEKHERGEIDAAEYFSHLRKVLKLDASDSEIAAGWNAIFLNEIEETVDYIHAVKDRLPCFAFSNSNPTHQACWMPTFPRVVESFQEIFVSSELGLRKPEPEAFKAIASATNLDLGAILFFDDSLKNVEGAQALGMHAIHVRSHLDVKKALLDIGVF